MTAPGGMRWATAVILLTALVLRLAWAALVPVLPLASDPFAYDTLAWTLVTSGEYGWVPGDRSSHWPPGTSFLCSLLFRVFGHVYWPIAVLNALLGTAIVALGMALGRRYFDGRTAGLTGWILALWPSQIQFTTLLVSEIPFTVLLLAALWVHSGPLAGTASAALRRGAAMGALLGIATYVRVEGLLLPVALAIGSSLGPGPRRWHWLAAGAALVVAIAMVAPWSVRNTRLNGQFALVSTSVGENLWMGNNPDSTGGFQASPELPGMSNIERDHHLRAKALRYVADHPWEFVVRTLYKAVRFHERDTMGVHWNEAGLARLGAGPILGLKVVSQLFWLAVLAGAVGGAVLLLYRRGWRALGHPLIVVWAYLTAVHAVSIVLQDRFHFPIHALLAVLAAHALLWAARRGAPAAADLTPARP